jgi:hypothetical protein
MPRTLPAALLIAGLIAAAVGPADAQDRKTGKLPRIAVDDPAKAKEDPDFAVQGEYVGHAGTSKKDTTASAAQVVALGGGRFDVKWYNGGLPGAGWDGKPAEVLRGERKDGKVILSRTQEGKTVEVGMIEDGKLTIAPIAEMTKTERKSPTLGARPPEGAVVLFDGPDDVAKWDRGRLAELSDGKFLAVSRTGNIRSKQAFGAIKAHVEFRLPWMPNSRGQGRGNSGVYIQDRYEVQVLDSFGLSGENNECGGIYTQYKPLVNMCLPPMQWQTYDIEFTPAEFDAGGKRTKPARLTLLHNGVKIHDAIEFKGPTPGGQPEKPTPGPLHLQDHGDPVVYRNVWVVETK